MSYKLFIDDDAFKDNVESWRKPPSGEMGWRIATTSSEAIFICCEFGIPEFISFDHDLGIAHRADGIVADTSMIFLKELFEIYPDAILEIKDYSIHSKNPEGAKNIQSYMDSWRRSKNMV